MVLSNSRMNVKYLVPNSEHPLLLSNPCHSAPPRHSQLPLSISFTALSDWIVGSDTLQWRDISQSTMPIRDLHSAQ